MNHNETIEDWFYLYSDDIYNFLIYYTGSRDIEDLVQEVFIKAINSLDQFQEAANPKTWLIAIARNLVIDQRRRGKRIKFLPFDLVSLKPFLTETESPEAIILDNETVREIYSVISKLRPVTYKEVLLFRLVIELSVDQTSDILGWSPQKVSVTYSRAIKALKKKLETKTRKEKYFI